MVAPLAAAFGATKSATEIAVAEINKRYEAYEETKRHAKRRKRLETKAIDAMHDSAYEMHTCIITRTPRTLLNKRVCDAFCQILSLALTCLMMSTHSDWHGTRMASTRRGSQAETMSCHRARLRIASSTQATSKYSKFTLPRAMGRGTHLCFPDAGMLHKFHVALAYLRNSVATRALWQNQPCHKLLPSGLKLHQKNDDMEARRRKWPGGKSENCVFDQSNIQLVDYT